MVLPLGRRRGNGNRLIRGSTRHKAQTIKLPIATKTTGRNHLSRNFCIGST